MLARLNHIAIAVNDLPNTLKFYEDTFGLKASPISELPTQGVRIATIALENMQLEFVSPLNQSSPISNFLTKRGDGLHHITFETSSLQQDLEQIKSKGIRSLSEYPTPGYDGNPIIFLHPKDTRGVLIELEETHPK
jgi:methylmalonyl-CoA epimerase